MKFLIISDLHSNLEALEQFVESTRKVDYDKLVCLGDIVGYGPNPNEVVDWVREHADIVLAGNHDYAVVGKTDVSCFNTYAKRACLWTAEVLTKKNSKYIASLPPILSQEEILWAHSSPAEPEEWHYVISKYDGIDNFPNFEERCCFIGHTHHPLILEENPKNHVERVKKEKKKLKKNHRYIFNVGSLGQPRDGNPDPAYAFFDSEKEVFEQHRFRYDFEKTQEKILERGLPRYLAERLAAGR